MICGTEPNLAYESGLIGKSELVVAQIFFTACAV